MGGINAPLQIGYDEPTKKPIAVKRPITVNPPAVLAQPRAIPASNGQQVIRQAAPLQLPAPPASIATPSPVNAPKPGGFMYNAGKTLGNLKNMGVKQAAKTVASKAVGPLLTADATIAAADAITGERQQLQDEKNTKLQSIGDLDPMSREANQAMNALTWGGGMFGGNQASGPGHNFQADNKINTDGVTLTNSHRYTGITGGLQPDGSIVAGPDGAPTYATTPPANTEPRPAPVPAGITDIGPPPSAQQSAIVAPPAATAAPVVEDGPDYKEMAGRGIGGLFMSGVLQNQDLRKQNMENAQAESIAEVRGEDAVSTKLEYENSDEGRQEQRDNTDNKNYQDIYAKMLKQISDDPATADLSAEEKAALAGQYSSKALASSKAAIKFQGMKPEEKKAYSVEQSRRKIVAAGEAAQTLAQKRDSGEITQEQYNQKASELRVEQQRYIDEHNKLKG